MNLRTSSDSFFDKAETKFEAQQAMLDKISQICDSLQ